MNSTKKSTMLSRNCDINFALVGLTCNIHSGQNLVKLKITDAMIGHKAGEFVFTRKKFTFKKNGTKN